MIVVMVIFLVPLVVLDPDSEDNGVIGTPRSTGFGPVMQKDIDPSTAGDQHDGQTFTFTIPPDSMSHF